MKLTSVGALALTGLFVAAACSSGSPSSPAATKAPTGGAPASAAASMAASMAPSMAPTSMSPESMAPASMAAESMAPSSTAPMSMAPSMGAESPAASTAAGGDIMSDAANLRVDLNYLFGEHLILAAKATGSALGGRTEQFDAYGALLNTNGTDIGAAIGQL